METDPFGLTRFVEAQGDDVYARALAELRAGRKRSHWMWFVFPQLAGLGRSSTAQFYGISGPDEARAYLAHPVLGPRLIECSSTVTRLSDDPVHVFGSVDALKLRSSMTLFLRASAAIPVFAEVLDRHYAGVPDEATDRLLA